MPKPLHFSWDVKDYSEGANTSSNPEAFKKTGTFIDSQNMRPSDLGNKDASTKIGGEEVIHDSKDTSPLSFYTSKYGSNQFSNADWTCRKEVKVNIGGKNRLVELWADKKAFGSILASFIRVDGLIVCASEDLAIIGSDHIQIDKSDGQGEIFVANNRTPTMIFNIKDMLLNSGETIDGEVGTATQKYFDDFNIDEYTVILNTPTNIPKFIELTSNKSYPSDKIFTTTGVQGLDAGKYAYSIRYVSSTGEASNWSLHTPVIPVVQALNSESDIYPYSKTYGNAAGEETIFGIVLKFRVDNKLNYDFLQIKRVSYNTGAGIDYVPTVSDFVGTYDISDGQLAVITLVDFGGREGTFSTSEDTQELNAIKANKSLKYYNNRLWLHNVEYFSRDISDDDMILDWNGEKIVPVVENIGKMGHADPYNATYHDTNQHYEKYNYAIVGFDATFSRSFAIPIENNFEMPQERDEVSIISKQYSYKGTSKAAAIDGTVPSNGTFEKFGLDNAIQKSTTDDKNIMDPAGPYAVFNPKNEADLEIDGHDYRVNTQVKNSGTLKDYNPKAFGPEYYSLGVAIKGVDPSKFPSWVKSFTVVRSKPANRVVCQGLVFYDISKRTNSFLIGKEKKSVYFFSPDASFFSGLVSGLTEFKSPNQRLQLVSPLGFFSETYNIDRIDSILYSRILKDNGDINIDGIDGVVDGSDHYVGFGKWRNQSFPSWCPGGDASNGDNIFNIDSIVNAIPTNSGVGERGEYFKINVSDDIYSKDVFTNTVSTKEYDDQEAKDFHEPVYVANIIQDNAEVAVQDVQSYIDTGTFIKLESNIGNIDDNQNVLNFQLVDERWEDCVNSLDDGNGNPIMTLGNINGVNFLASKYIYARKDNVEKAYLNVSYFNKASIEVIKTFIDLYGSYTFGNIEVFGMYEHVNVNLDNRFFQINFLGIKTEYGAKYIPEGGSSIWVKYDNTSPIRVFGGGNYISEGIFAPIDLRYATNEGGTGVFPKQDVRTGVGFPYYRLYGSTNFKIPVNAITGGVADPSFNEVIYDFVRQMVVMFPCTSKTNYNYTFEDTPSIDPTNRMEFPKTHYIMRPIEYKAGTEAFLLDNFVANGGKVFDEYNVDYPFEYRIWEYGGFRFLPLTNIDYYHKLNTVAYDSIPAVGFEEQNRYPTRSVYSLDRPTNTQNVANLRTFLSGNYYDISDESGEIKYSHKGDSDRYGNMLFVITSSGICALLIDKYILSDSGGGDLAAIQANDGNLVKNEEWISRKIGMEAEMWRSAVEVTVEKDDGSLYNALYFANLQGVYLFTNGQLANISKLDYDKTILEDYLEKIDGKYPATNEGVYITSGFDERHNEYLLQIGVPIGTNPDGIDYEKILVFNANKNKWYGQFTYRFERFITIDKVLYGVKNKYDSYKTSAPNSYGKALTFKLNSGTKINKLPISAFIINQCAPFRKYPQDGKLQFIGNEYKRFRLNSNNCPTQVLFYDELDQDVQAQIIKAHFKKYEGWEQYIPRRNESADVENKRMQGIKLIFKIEHNEEESFIVLESGVMYRELH